MSRYLSWNGIPNIKPLRYSPVSRHVLPAVDTSPLPWIPYGNGRSYGDVCLTDEGTMLLTRGMDRFIHFDSDTGVLRCESGITLYEILKLVVPQGWFLPCTPGTGFATLGGALANDVHGKNHHTSGSFGDHVRAFELVRSTDERLMCTPDTNPELFRATIAGLGLTGLVTWIEIQLAPIRNAWLWTESHRFENLEAFWPLNAEAEQRWPYTVAWIDCLAKGSAQGRGVLFCGQHAASQSDWPVYRQRQRKFPVMPPVSLVNHLSLRSFNAAYFRQPVYPEGKLSHFIPYFYPLDGIQNWNRIYGRRGFFQYQCVIPPENAQSGIPHLLSAIANSGQGSFLAVLKSFGNRAAPGLLSFSRPGTTLALDFPNKGDITQALLMRLDEIVAEAGGALYPAKDARMPAWMFQASYPQWESFTQYVDPAFKSHFWKRVTS